MLDLGRVFDRVVCINLDHRPDRWDRLQENLASVRWPFAPVQRVRAVNGRKTPAPPWWKAGAGAWGCYQSHLQVLSAAVHDGVNSLLILEDDAEFPQDFAPCVTRFLQLVPGDWDGMLLGGQHHVPPEAPETPEARETPASPASPRTPEGVCDGVVKLRYATRTHCHALRGRFIAEALRHLVDLVDHRRRPGFHVDHRLAMLQQCGRFNVYAPDPWLVGQAEGYSDIAGRAFGSRFWHTSGALARSGDAQLKLPPFVAVLGLHRSGSSCLAGVLYKLGVHMGQRLTGFETGGGGGFEAVGLMELCEKAYPFPSTERKLPREELLGMLRGHIQSNRKVAARQETLAGGKYPTLCAMGQELLELLGPDLRVIHIDRPIEESIRSLQQRSATTDQAWIRTTPEAAEALQRWLDETKRAFLAGIDHLTVHYHDLLADPRREVQRIVDFIGISPAASQVRYAVEHVRPAMRHFAGAEAHPR